MSKYYLASKSEESTRSIPVIEVSLEYGFDKLEDVQKAVKEFRADPYTSEYKWMVAKVFEEGELG